jgi:hypothetical protein
MLLASHSSLIWSYILASEVTIQGLFTSAYSLPLVFYATLVPRTRNRRLFLVLSLLFPLPFVYKKE